MTESIPKGVADRTPQASRWRRQLNPLTISGLAILLVLVVIAIVAPTVLGDAAQALTDNATMGPSREHLLGTDSLGRDIFARTLVATRLTLLMTVGATALSIIVGVVVGIGLWLAPRPIREPGLRIVELAVTFPGILLALIIAAIVGQGVIPAVIAIGLGGAPAFARLAANLAAKVSRREFVQTARLLGVGPVRIAMRHILPNMSEPMLILMASAFGASLIDLSGLSFIGLGVQSPQFDFGFLLNDALHNIYTHPAQVFGPAVMITVTGLAIMLVGDGLAAAANPRSSMPGVPWTRRAAARAVERAATTITEPTTGDRLLEIDNLVISGPTGQPIVKGISFHIDRGEILGLVGESGSGKSLTAMSVARLLPSTLAASAQRMQLGDIDLIHRVPPKQLARAVSLVYQDPGSTFDPALRMGGQLSDVLRVHLGMTRDEARERILENFRAVRLTDPEHRYRQHPHELSGGMRQRAMISSALNVDPLLLIADEPTTALDVTVQREVLRLLKQQNLTQRTAILFISHDIGVVKALCDRVMVMRHGEILEEVAAADLDPDHVRHPYTRQLLNATPHVEVPAPDLEGVGAR